MKIGNMEIKKPKKKVEKMLSQCPHCHSIEILHKDGNIRWQFSIAIFAKLEDKICYPCKVKPQTSGTSHRTVNDIPPEVSH